MKEEPCYRDFSYEQKAALWQSFRDGSRESLEILLTSNYRLVQAIISRFSFDPESREDLFQAGVIGLLTAVSRFDPNYGTDFAVYAFSYIKGEVLRALGEIKGKKKGFAMAKAKEAKEKNMTLPAFAAAAELSLEELTEMTETRAFADAGAEAMFERVEDRLMVQGALAALKDEERQLLFYRYGRHMSQLETGEILHLSQTRISRREKEILAKLRQWI